MIQVRNSPIPYALWISGCRLIWLHPVTHKSGGSSKLIWFIIEISLRIARNSIVERFSVTHSPMKSFLKPETFLPHPSKSTVDGPLFRAKAFSREDSFDSESSFVRSGQSSKESNV